MEEDVRPCNCKEEKHKIVSGGARLNGVWCGRMRWD